MRIIDGIRIMIFAAASGLPVFSARAETLVHHEASLYHNIYVHDNNGIRCLRFSALGRGLQSCIRLRFPDEMVFPNTRLMMGTLYINPAPQKILLIGLGGGTVPAALGKLLPEADMDIVEIDPAIARIASNFFGFRATPRQNIVIEDGRVFVKHALQDGKSYDIIVLDVFKGDFTPEHMVTQEFLRDVRQLLAPGGIVTSNTNIGAGIYDHESTTWHSVFGDFLNWKSGGNRVVMAAKDGAPTLEAMQKNAAALDSRLSRFGLGMAWMKPMLVERPDWNINARILTDQYGPANLLKLRGQVYGE